MKTKLVSLRMSEADYVAILAASEAAGRSMSEHLRQSAMSSTATAARVVPQLNRLAWLDLAAPLNNLNQIARSLNHFGLHIRESGLSADVIRSIFELMKSTLTAIAELQEQIPALRRELSGSSPLESAASTLENFATASKVGRLPVSRERLQAAADELRNLGRALGEVAP